MRLRSMSSIGVLLALQAPALEAKSPWRTGTYTLSGEKWDQGTLTIHALDAKTATFSIETARCRRDCETDTPMANVGSVEVASMEISGTTGTYKSAGPSEAPQAPDLGICVLRFSSVNRRTIKVTQLSNCWWFGLGVYVSGTYKLEKKHAPK